MRHKIAIVNNLNRNGAKLLDELANNNKHHFFSKNKGELYLADGTMIKVATSIHSVRGAKYTQIIIDKYSLGIFDNNINDIMHYIMNNSPIPGEFVVIEVD